MVARRHPLALPAIGIALVLLTTHAASAQRATRVQLATLENVQAELNLTAAQTKIAADATEELILGRRDLFQSGGGDFGSALKKMQELAATATSKLTSQLNDGQNKRLTEIFVQANGVNSVFDDEVAAGLQIDDEAKQKLSAVRSDNMQRFLDAFQETQNLSDDERSKKFETLRREADEKLLALLSAEQREQLEKMKGKAIDLDLSPILRRR
jgi:hypothetical protein